MLPETDVLHSFVFFCWTPGFSEGTVTAAGDGILLLPSALQGPDSFHCKPPQYLRHPGTADAEVTGKRRPALELAGVQQRLVIAGELNRITAFLGYRFWLRFPGERSIPCEEGDDGRTT